MVIPPAKVIFAIPPPKAGSIHDTVDSRGDLFPETRAVGMLEIFGALSEECDVLRKASAHIVQLKQNIN